MSAGQSQALELSFAHVFAPCPLLPADCSVWHRFICKDDNSAGSHCVTLCLHNQMHTFLLGICQQELQEFQGCNFVSHWVRCRRPTDTRSQSWHPSWGIHRAQYRITLASHPWEQDVQVTLLSLRGTAKPAALPSLLADSSGGTSITNPE